MKERGKDEMREGRMGRRKERMKEEMALVHKEGRERKKKEGQKEERNGKRSGMKDCFSAVFL